MTAWLNNNAVGTALVVLVVGGILTGFALWTVRKMVDRAVDDFEGVTYRQIGALRDGAGELVGDAVERIQTHSAEQHDTTRRALETTGSYTDSQELPVSQSLPSVADAQALIEAARAARATPPPQTPQQRHPAPEAPHRAPPTGSGYNGQYGPPPAQQPDLGGRSPVTSATYGQPAQPPGYDVYRQNAPGGPQTYQGYYPATPERAPQLAGGEPPPRARRAPSASAVIGDQLADEHRARTGERPLARPETVPPPDEARPHRHRLGPNHHDYRR